MPMMAITTSSSIRVKAGRILEDRPVSEMDR
jgi:hypothetical protein